jgi:shikimate dehydrogenase
VTAAGAAKCLAVLGDPIEHSRSPAMHEAALRVLGLPHHYLAFRVREEGLGAALLGARAMGFLGLNLTVPHKQAALRFVDARSPEAERIGAINTVRFTDFGLVGHNTDAAGFARALAELRSEPGPLSRRAVVLGGGGAARAVVDALLHVPHPPEIAWVSRDPTRLPAWGVEVCTWEALRLGDADLLVNATTVGMRHGPDSFPVALPISELGPDAGVIDLVYPRRSGGLLDDAAAAGFPGQDGLPMLLWQGVAALELWLERTLPVEAIDAMRATLGR